MANITFVDHTLAVWQPYYNEALSQRDCEEIIANWSAYLSVLSEWAVAGRGYADHEK